MAAGGRRLCGSSLRSAAGLRVQFGRIDACREASEQRALSTLSLPMPDITHMLSATIHAE